LIINYQLYVDETDVYKRELKLNRKGFTKYEELGLFKMFCLREDGELIGQCGAYITPSMHTGELTANEDFLFIKKEFRGGNTVFDFVRFVEDRLKAFGVKEVVVSARLENETFKITDKLGYKRIAYQCSKRFED